MVDTKEFDNLAFQFQSLRNQLAELRPLVANATVEAYRSGVQVGYILKALGISPATVYGWLREAGNGTLPMTPKKLGRPRKNAIKPAPELIDKAFNNVHFAWFEDRIRVDANGKRVLIDPERLNYEGDRELGQLLVSGTDLAMLRKFNDFVNGG